MKLNTLQNPVIPETVDSSNQPLTTGEEMRLSHLEKTISNSKEDVAKAFVQIGKALVEIRDDKLYRANHDSFEVYVERRFKISRVRAYQMISAQDVATSLAGILEIKNERVAREIAKAEPKVQRKAAKAIAKLPERQVTAKAAKQIVEQIQSRPKGGLAAVAMAEKEKAKTEVVNHGLHSEPLKTLGPTKKSEQNPGQIIADWWAQNRARLLEYPATAPDVIVQNIIDLFK